MTRLSSVCLLAACESAVVTPDGGRSGSDAAMPTDSGPAPGPAPDSGPQVHPMPVADCGELPAAGTWEDITPVELSVPDSLEVFSVAVDPYTQTVYAAGSNQTARGPGEAFAGSGLMRSNDCGATWEQVSTGENSDLIINSASWAVQLAPRPDGPPTVYIDTGYGDGTVFRSTNGGVDFERLDPDPSGAVNDGPSPFVHALTMDHTDPRHLAVAFHDACRAPYRTTCFSRTYDGGDTWEIMDGPGDLGWQEGASITILGRTRYLYLSATGSYMTTDSGATWEALNDAAHYCCYGGVAAFTGDAVYAPLQEGVFVSRRDSAGNLGASWERVPDSPNVFMVLATDTHLIGARPGFGRMEYFTIAALSDLSHWTVMPQETDRGPNQMAYDPVHRIVYAANWGAGIWRLTAP
jgi:photosystem II stability/assembly factor-like uncharacterized protein